MSVNVCFPMKNTSTIFHITHWKAGSQWIHRILRELFPQSIVSPKIYEKQFLEEPLVQGGVYPTVYVTREQFLSVELPVDYKKFIVIRDLRDTLISGYFSVRYSHALIDDDLKVWREKLNSLSLENGLLWLMEEWLPSSAKVQESWSKSDEPIIRYEDLLSRDIEILSDILLDKFTLDISSETLIEIIEKNRFKQVAGGRIPGKEDVFSHQRKGVAGDWRNHFTPLVTKKFDKLYGALLFQTGYEK